MTRAGPLPTPSGPSPGRLAGGGLRRFARPPRPAARTTAGAADGAQADTAHAGGVQADERCELCGEAIGNEHSHLVDLQRRSIGCACKACALLFTKPGGRYRTVPDRVRHDPLAPLTDAEWAELQIPVSVAFFFANSALGQVIASYPSPAGVTECELDLAAWDRLAAAHPLLGSLAPDVEAILVIGARDARDGARESGNIETFLVPIDVCYSLAGALRLEWHGFDGGSEVRRILADLLAGLRKRARPLDNVREA